MTGLLDKARNASPTQRRIALALLIGLLLLVPQLPLVVVAALAVLAAQPLLVGMALGAVLVHRRRKTTRS